MDIATDESPMSMLCVSVSNLTVHISIDSPRKLVGALPCPGFDLTLTNTARILQMDTVRRQQSRRRQFNETRAYPRLAW